MYLYYHIADMYSMNYYYFLKVFVVLGILGCFIRVLQYNKIIRQALFSHIIQRFVLIIKIKGAAFCEL